MIFRIFLVDMYWFFPILISLNILKIYLNQGKYLKLLDKELLKRKWFQNFIFYCMVLETSIFQSNKLRFFSTFVLVVFLNVCAINGYFKLLYGSFSNFFDIYVSMIFLAYCIYFDLRWRFLNYYDLQLEGPWIYWDDLFCSLTKILDIKVKSKISANIPLALASIPYSRFARLSIYNKRPFGTMKDTLKELLELSSRHSGTIRNMVGGTTLAASAQWHYQYRLEAIKEGRAYSASLSPTQYQFAMKNAYKELMDVSKQINSLKSDKSFIRTEEGKQEFANLMEYKTLCDKNYRLYGKQYVETALVQGAASQSVLDAEDNFWSFKYVPGRGLIKVKFANPLIKAQNVGDEVRSCFNENDNESLESYIHSSPSEIMEVGRDMSRGMSMPRLMNETPASPPPPFALSLSKTSFFDFF